MASINIFIIERNITGCATDDEQDILYAWLAHSKVNRDTYFQMKNIWDSCRVKNYSQEDIRREWESFVKRHYAVGLKPVRKNFTIRAWMRYAAAIAITIGLTGLLTIIRQSPKPISSQPQLTWQKITVPHGQRTQIILSDGSKVWLNAGTVLQFPSDFGVQTRQVIVEGEAGFLVTPSDIPFQVSADEVEISVLGTHFNVRNYSTDDVVETTLFEGSVSLQTPVDELIMNPGDVAVYQKDKKVAVVGKMTDLSQKSAWYNNQLIINGERLADIANTLERWFDVHITITDHNLQDYRYTGKFVYNETVIQVLKVISATTPIRYKVDGNEIIISKK